MSSLQLTVPRWKMPKISYEYHRSYLIKFCERKRREETAKGRTEEFQWLESPIGWLDQSEFILQAILTHPSWTLETKRTYTNALKQILRNEYEQKELPAERESEFLAAIAHIGSAHSQLSAETLRSEKNNALRNDGRDLRWMPWTTITEIAKALSSRYNTDPTNYRLAQMDLLLSLYVDCAAPLRLNYGCVRLFPADDERKMLDEHELNYVFRNSDGHDTFCLNHDKLIGSRGATRIELPNEITERIKNLEARFGHRRYLLTHPKNVTEPLDQPHSRCNGSMQLLAAIPMVNEERASLLNVCTIRSAFATKFLESLPSENQVEQMAVAMRTSPQMLRIYYRKIDPTHPKSDNGVPID